MRRKMFIIGGLCIVSVLLILFWGINFEIFDYVIRKRLIKVVAIVITGFSIGSATLVFQAITNNRILTPSILGLDSLYMLVQLMVVVFFGPFSALIMNSYINFTMSTVIMIIFSLVLYKLIFSKDQSIFFIVLLGIIMGTFFNSITGMLQLLMSPDAYSIVLERMFANFADIKIELLGISAMGTAFILWRIGRKADLLDVLSLGKGHAINLGVDYQKEVKILLIEVFALTAISTALVGPITFLGFFAVNIAKSGLDTYKHKLLLVASGLIAVISLCLGQFVIEKVFGFGLPVSVIINLLGGTYFIYLLLKLNRRKGMVVQND